MSYLHLNQPENGLELQTKIDELTKEMFEGDSINWIEWDWKMGVLFNAFTNKLGNDSLTSYQEYQKNFNLTDTFTKKAFNRVFFFAF